MDTSNFPKQTEYLQKLSVYGKSPRGEACILHYRISRQKQIPN